MVRNPQAVRNQLFRQRRDLYIFEDRFIKEQSIFTISLENGLSLRQIYRIIKQQRTKYEYTFNLIWKKVFGFSAVEIKLKDMQNHDVLVATESWIKLQVATIDHFLKLAENKQGVIKWKSTD